MQLRVLIVEDEPLIAMDLKSVLEDVGHHVVGTAFDMAGALRIAETGLVEVAVMDVMLANEPDGVETARHLRETYGIPSLFVSAHLDEATRMRTMAFGPVGHVSKPYRPDEIVDPLRSVTPGPGSRLH